MALEKEPLKKIFFFKKSGLYIQNVKQLIEITLREENTIDLLLMKTEEFNLTHYLFKWGVFDHSLQLQISRLLFVLQCEQCIVF